MCFVILVARCFFLLTVQRYGDFFNRQWIQTQIVPANSLFVDEGQKAAPKRGKESPFQAIIALKQHFPTISLARSGLFLYFCRHYGNSKH